MQPIAWAETRRDIFIEMKQFTVIKHEAITLKYEY